ncbi:MAG: peroxiredoxin family protein [Verrucomicrobiota bacterium]
MNLVGRLIRSLALGGLALGLVGNAGLRARPADDAKPVAPGHSMHGEAFDEGPRRKARLMEGMPAIRFDVTTTNDLARRFFLQGVGQLHGFWYLEAERSFRGAAASDTNCAMAYWGMAMANINNAKRAASFVQEATRRKATASAREQLWIDALAEYHRDPNRNEQERRRDYIRALENIVFKHPDDVEAKAFLAFHIWDNGSRGIPIGSAQAVESLLKEVFAAQPSHPAHHYRIHLWDGEKDESAARALPSAARSGQSSPGVAHQWHMAGHTFNKLKRYPDMAWQQEASVRVDNTQLMQDRLMPDQIHNYAHNSEWLVQTLNYIGRPSRAVELACNMIEMPRHPRFNTLDLRTNGTPYEVRGGTAVQGRRRLLETLLRWELWEVALRLADSPLLEATPIPEEQGRRARLMGLAHVGLGQLDRVPADIEALRKAMQNARDLRRVVVDAAEAKALSEKKGRGDVDKAMADALKPFSEVLENLEDHVRELEFAADVARGTTNDMLPRLAGLKSVSKERMARWRLQLGDTTNALALSKEAVEGGTNQVHPLLVRTEVLWRTGKTNDALESFRVLRGLSGWLEVGVPAVRRIAPVIEAAGLGDDWRPRPGYAEDSGLRPPIETLGSFEWVPQPAPELVARGHDGTVHRLSERRGKPLLVVFYLGHRCVHCMEQLQALAPRAREFQEAGIDLLAVGTDTPEGLAKSLQDAGPSGQFPFPLAADPGLDSFRAWHAHDDFEGVPLHGVFLVDAEGKVRWQDIGPEPFTDFHFLVRECRRLLSIRVRG